MNPKKYTVVVPQWRQLACFTLDVSGGSSKTGRIELAHKALDIVEGRLSVNGRDTTMARTVG